MAAHVPAKTYAEQWDVEGLKKDLNETFGRDFPVDEWAKEEGVADTEINERLIEETDKAAASRAAEIGVDVMRRIEKAILLQVLDTNWREHLQQLDHLRSVIWLRGHGQRDPVNEFKTESFGLFESLLDGLRRDVTRMLMHVQVRRPEDVEPQRPDIPMTETHVNPLTGENEMAAPVMPRDRTSSRHRHHARAVNAGKN